MVFALFLLILDTNGTTKEPEKSAGSATSRADKKEIQISKNILKNSNNFDEEEMIPLGVGINNKENVNPQKSSKVTVQKYRFNQQNSFKNEAITSVLKQPEKETKGINETYKKETDEKLISKIPEKKQEPNIQINKSKNETKKITTENVNAKEKVEKIKNDEINKKQTKEEEKTKKLNEEKATKQKQTEENKKAKEGEKVIEEEEKQKIIEESKVKQQKKEKKQEQEAAKKEEDGKQKKIEETKLKEEEKKKKEEEKKKKEEEEKKKKEEEDKKKKVEEEKKKKEEEDKKKKEEEEKKKKEEEEEEKKKKEEERRKKEEERRKKEEERRKKEEEERKKEEDKKKKEEEERKKKEEEEKKKKEEEEKERQRKEEEKKKKDEEDKKKKQQEEEEKQQKEEESRKLKEEEEKKQNQEETRKTQEQEKKETQKFETKDEEVGENLEEQQKEPEERNKFDNAFNDPRKENPIHSKGQEQSSKQDTEDSFLIDEFLPETPKKPSNDDDVDSELESWLVKDDEWQGNNENTQEKKATKARPKIIDNTEQDDDINEFLFKEDSEETNENTQENTEEKDTTTDTDDNFVSDNQESEDEETTERHQRRKRSKSRKSKEESETSAENEETEKSASNVSRERKSVHRHGRRSRRSRTPVELTPADEEEIGQIFENEEGFVHSAKEIKEKRRTEEKEILDSKHESLTRAGAPKITVVSSETFGFLLKKPANITFQTKVKPRTAFCRIKDTVVQAKVISENTISCGLPSIKLTLRSAVEVSLDGEKWSIPVLIDTRPDDLLLYEIIAACVVALILVYCACCAQRGSRRPLGTSPESFLPMTTRNFPASPFIAEINEDAMNNNDEDDI